VRGRGGELERGRIGEIPAFKRVSQPD